MEKSPKDLYGDLKASGADQDLEPGGIGPGDNEDKRASDIMFK